MSPERRLSENDPLRKRIDDILKEVRDQVMITTAENVRRRKLLIQLLCSMIALQFAVVAIVFLNNVHLQRKSCTDATAVRIGSMKLLEKSALANQAVANDSTNTATVHRLRAAEAAAQRAQVRTLRASLSRSCSERYPYMQFRP